MSSGKTINTPLCLDMFLETKFYLLYIECIYKTRSTETVHSVEHKHGLQKCRPLPYPGSNWFDICLLHLSGTENTSVCTSTIITLQALMPQRRQRQLFVEERSLLLALRSISVACCWTRSLVASSSHSASFWRISTISEFWVTSSSCLVKSWRRIRYTKWWDKAVVYDDYMT